jgi:hypothetical protein
MHAILAETEIPAEARYALLLVLLIVMLLAVLLLVAVMRLIRTRCKSARKPAKPSDQTFVDPWAEAGRRLEVEPPDEEDEEEFGPTG